MSDKGQIHKKKAMHSDADAVLPTGSTLIADLPAGSWVEIKEIHGHLYRYRRWRERGRLRSRYLGKA